jgi:hypothetical protein
LRTGCPAAVSYMREKTVSYHLAGEYAPTLAAGFLRTTGPCACRASLESPGRGPGEERRPALPPERAASPVPPRPPCAA